MINRLKNILFIVCTAATFAAFAKDNNCIDCGHKQVDGMPTNKSLSALENIAKSASSESENQANIELFCMKFTQTPKEMVGSLIREFESTNLPADKYFLHSQCQPKGYSDRVKSPMIHYIAEAPDSRANFLNSIWLYYSKKRKEPEIFTKILNVPNTQGETILDYIESLKKNGHNVSPALQEPLMNLITFICSHGGVYLTYKDKSCPK